jgi:hypothetical protein
VGLRLGAKLEGDELVEERPLKQEEDKEGGQSDQEGVRVGLEEGDEVGDEKAKEGEGASEEANSLVHIQSITGEILKKQGEVFRAETQVGGGPGGRSRQRSRS